MFDAISANPQSETLGKARLFNEAEVAKEKAAKTPAQADSDNDACKDENNECDDWAKVTHPNAL